MIKNKEFIEYWDQIIKEWSKNGIFPKGEETWFEVNPKLKDWVELMPEPYWGDPTNCSVVILNYNPACKQEISIKDQGHYQNTGSRSISRIMAPQYSAYALPFSILEEEPPCPFGCAEGRSWWMKRNEWFKRLIPDSSKKPFALELCAWHSPNWSSTRNNPRIYEYIKEKVEPIFKDAIKKSDLGIGLCIGKEFGDILKTLDYEDVTEKLLNKKINDCGGWKPLVQNRWYRIYRSKDGIYVINSWSKGSNQVPSKDFIEYEKEIVKLIKNRI